MAVAGHLAFAAIGLSILGGSVAAQGSGNPAAQGAPAFDVVSVKPGTQGARGRAVMQVQPGGRFTATNVPAIDLILNAYGLQSFQVVNAPSWASTDRFDLMAQSPHEITSSDVNPAGLGPPSSHAAEPSGGDTGKEKAKSDKLRQTGAFEGDGSTQPSAFQLMMRAMLADRFGLKVHIETRQAPIYELVLARNDRRLGPKLTVSAMDCAAQAADARGRKSGGTPAAGQPTKCGIRVEAGSLMAGGVPMAQIAADLSVEVNRTVLDHTGLAGNWDVELRYTPDQSSARDSGAPAGQSLKGNGQKQQIDPNGPSLFTALQEQLGLKLQSAEGPGDVLVIDHIDHPAAD